MHLHRLIFFLTSSLDRGMDLETNWIGPWSKILMLLFSFVHQHTGQNGKMA